MAACDRPQWLRGHRPSTSQTQAVSPAASSKDATNIAPARSGEAPLTPLPPQRRTDHTGPRRARSLLRALAVLMLLTSGQAQAGGAGSAAPPPPPGSSDSALSARCAAAQRAAGAQASSLRSALPRLDALLLGEIHTSEADHVWQLATLEAARQLRPRLSLGLEMVPAARQAVLDRYNAGQLDEAALLQQVGWAEVWGHDPGLYLPLLRWARQQEVPLLALNAEPELVKRVRRQGLAAIPPLDREGLGTPRPPGPAYRQRLETAWRGHGGGGGPLNAGQASDLQRFIDSQLIRDRAMAERIAAAHRRDPGRLVVALIGRGHLEDGDGVPRQLADLGLSRQLSLTRVAPPQGCGAVPARARLGAYLESDAAGVWVRRVAPGSAAEAAGLRPGDRILELDGAAVDHAGQVIRGVRLHPDGVPLRLTIERAGRRLRLQLSLPASSETRQASRDNGARSGDRSRPAPRPSARPALLALSPP